MKKDIPGKSSVLVKDCTPFSQLRKAFPLRIRALRVFPGKQIVECHGQALKDIPRIPSLFLSLSLFLFRFRGINALPKRPLEKESLILCAAKEVANLTSSHIFDSGEAFTSARAHKHAVIHRETCWIGTKK